MSTVSNCLNMNDGKRCSYMIGPFTSDRCYPTFENKEISFVQCLMIKIGDIPATLEDNKIIIKQMPDNCPHMKERLF